MVRATSIFMIFKAFVNDGIVNVTVRVSRLAKMEAE